MSSKAQKTRHLAACISCAVLLALLWGCGGDVLEPEVCESIYFYPGVFTLTKSDSLYIGFRFRVYERWCWPHLGFDPGEMEFIRVVDPCCRRYYVEASHYKSVSAAWPSDSTYWTGWDFYQYLEPTDSVRCGNYPFTLKWRDGRVLTRTDCLSPGPLRISEYDLVPADSSVMEISEVAFDFETDTAIGAWEVAAFDAQGGHVYLGRYSTIDLWRECREDSVITVDPTLLLPGRWYSWTVRAWDESRSNCWQMAGRRWFYVED